MTTVDLFKLDVSQSVAFLQSKGFGNEEYAIILGSGLSGFIESLSNPKIVSFHEIPGYPKSTVAGHAGKLVSGTLFGKQVLAAAGRFHFYEGHPASAVIYPVKIFHGLGINKLIITNAAGSCNPAIPPGSLALLKGVVNLYQFNPLRGTKFPESFAFDQSFDQKLIENLVSELQPDLPIHSATLGVATGPTYETTAEVAMNRTFGIDVLSMSTYPEMLSAAVLGMQFLGVSCVTNFATGISSAPLSHEEVTAMGGKFTQHLLKLAKQF